MANVIDLFCGAGGFSKGFQDMGYNILLGIDNSIHKLRTYSKNIDPEYYMIAPKYIKTGKAKDKKKTIKEIEDKNDIVNILKKDIENVIQQDNVDVIIGSPPCKDYSKSNIGNKTDEDRMNLHKEFFRLVKLIEPTWFVLENVVEFFETKEGELLKFEIEPYGYKTKLFIVNAKDYGVAQSRERGFFIGTTLSDVDFNLEDYKENTNITIEEAISDLEVENSDSDMFMFSKYNLSEYQKKLRSGEVFVSNHKTTNHKKETIENIIKIKNGKCKLSNRVRQYHEVIGTITGEFDNPKGICNCIHPKFNRTFTAREAARFQSFPDDFIFIGNRDEISKQIGDAVPPIMARCIAKMIKDISYDK